MLYVASGNNGQGQIWAFSIDPNTGALGSPTQFSSPEFLLQMKVDPSNTFLYASDFDSGKVRAYSIDSTSGSLAEVNGSPFGSSLTSGNGGPLAISPNGKFLFFSDSVGNLATFSISSGTLTPGTGGQDNNQPFDFAVDPLNRYLYVANQSDSSGGDFSVFSIDASSGGITPISGSPFTFQDNSGPFAIAVHPNGRFIYSTLSNTQDVAGLTVDTSTGVLSKIAGSPFNTGILIPKGIAMHPSGKFLYVSAEGVSSIIIFNIDPTTGALSKLTSFTVGVVQLAIDPSGNFLYAASPAFDEVFAYKIDQGNGNLTAVPGSPFSAGVVSGALAIVNLQ
jgi:6-phosphogluconolactonase (cycloisomerase 2 family)